MCEHIVILNRDFLWWTLSTCICVVLILWDNQASNLGRIESCWYYPFGLLKLHHQGFICAGVEKKLDVVPAAIFISDGPLKSKSAWRGTGIAVPVFSLRSQSSVGSGEFVDIRPLVDFCSLTGTHLSPNMKELCICRYSVFDNAK